MTGSTNQKAPREDEAMAAMSWPWHIKITYADGRVREDDYSEEFDPLGHARQVSGRPDVARVEVSVAFVGGEAVAPQAAVPADARSATERMQDEAEEAVASEVFRKP
jgi:hypothetical protein